MCFVKRLMKQKMEKKIKENKEILLIDKDKKDFEIATHCFICG